MAQKQVHDLGARPTLKQTHKLSPVDLIPTGKPRRRKRGGGRKANQLTADDKKCISLLRATGPMTGEAAQATLKGKLGLTVGKTKAYKLLKLAFAK